MTKMDKASMFSRRSVLKSGGALIVSVAMPIGLDAMLDVECENAVPVAVHVSGESVA